ncbi:hypothetical protein PILCRDRAFT_812062 [Piloderma croceum F 1598]|uniref:DUF6534 domain-containing protein n=1 Tax=Piloderma croceum (strain F 1598) TaxID=765440 RepID=A0A0C3GF61_PILCF|nr:hypothetical protein PILCRDRAFT_812062 [Piloderma croceum F 1598]
MSTAAPVVPGPLPAFHLDLGDTYGALFIGLVISAVLFGITNLQLFVYSQSYKDDNFWSKFSITWLWFLDALHLALISHAVYFYLVTNYGNPLELTKVIWSFHLQLVVDMATIVTVQALYAVRLWKLTKIDRYDFKSKIIPTIVTFLVIAAFGISIAVSKLIYSIKYFTQFDLIKWATFLALVTASVVDILIAASLCFTLARLRTGFERTDSMIKSLMLYVINTGVLTSLCSLTALSLYAVYPHNLIFLAVEFPMTKLYVNAFLAMFNARHHLQAALNKTMNTTNLDAFVHLALSR